MPHRHTVKSFVENGHYHVYNRGVEKRVIFVDEEDYTVFLYLLKYFLSPEAEREKHPLANTPNASLIRPRPLPGLADEVELLAYCLMPNHFHLLIKQKTKAGMTKLLRKLSTTYALYFNRRYERVGHLFQSIYKAVLITEDPYLLHISRYIHLNPAELTRKIPSGPVALWAGRPVRPADYPYSSYQYYLGKKQAAWLKSDPLLAYFEGNRNHPEFNRFLSYQEFVEGHAEDPKEAIGRLALD